MDEETIDRRAHWLQVGIGLVIAATIWCVKLEMNVESLKKESDNREQSVGQYRDARNEELKRMSERIVRLEQYKEDHDGQCKSVAH